MILGSRSKIKNRPAFPSPDARTSRPFHATVGCRSFLLQGRPLCGGRSTTSLGLLFPTNPPLAFMRPPILLYRPTTRRAQAASSAYFICFRRVCPGDSPLSYRCPFQQGLQSSFRRLCHLVKFLSLPLRHSPLSLLKMLVVLIRLGAPRPPLRISGSVFERLELSSLRSRLSSPLFLSLSPSPTLPFCFESLSPCRAAVSLCPEMAECSLRATQHPQSVQLSGLPRVRCRQSPGPIDAIPLLFFFSFSHRSIPHLCFGTSFALQH